FFSRRRDTLFYWLIAKLKKTKYVSRGRKKHYLTPLEGANELYCASHKSNFPLHLFTFLLRLAIIPTPNLPIGHEI
ncbi:MAG TPA: hypothetical protein PLT39_07820, partial [Thermotogota bacterium]|nr:hypothetical protein [Thermotogota bacterium]HPG98774.1 hypothetical protein [Thermotogota bacterium]HPL39859.1 hypothetical protein [Thermotogota bacterium]